VVPAGTPLPPRTHNLPHEVENPGPHALGTAVTTGTTVEVDGHLVTVTGSASFWSREPLKYVWTVRILEYPTQILLRERHYTEWAIPPGDDPLHRFAPQFRDYFMIEEPGKYYVMLICSGVRPDRRFDQIPPGADLGRFATMVSGFEVVTIPSQTTAKP
jgi:hypothetical protein